MKEIIDIPIYPGQLILLQVDDLNKVSSEYNLEPLNNSFGCCFQVDDNYAIAVLDHTTPAIIAHECLHFIGYLFEECGIVMDVTNDEPQCYLLEWAVGQCHKFFKV